MFLFLVFYSFYTVNSIQDIASIKLAIFHMEVLYNKNPKLISLLITTLFFESVFKIWGVLCYIGLTVITSLLNAGLNFHQKNKLN